MMQGNSAGMSAIELLSEPPPHRNALAWLLLAHGAGAPMTSPFMNTITALLTARGIGVSRFEFAYMAQRRTGGNRRPPPKAERLASEFIAAMAALDDLPERYGAPLFIGGKSMGGRVATLVADALFAEGRTIGAVALGYPFHPPKKPDTLRTVHLEVLQTPLLIVQGERDPFGTRAEVESYPLSPNISIAWAKDGDHDLKPRAGQGTTHKANIAAAADQIVRFVAGFAS